MKKDKKEMLHVTVDKAAKEKLIKKAEEKHITVSALINIYAYDTEKTKN